MNTVGLHFVLANANVTNQPIVTQAGDIGFSLSRCLGLFYPSSCKASHLNFAPVQMPKGQNAAPGASNTSDGSPREKADQARTQWFFTKGRGYYEEHTTKPQTLNYSLADSPVGLLAWIREKLHDWTDDYRWTDDEILTWISIYLFSTAGPGAAQRIYYESLNDAELRPKLTGFIPDVKLGFARFPKELVIMPKSWNESMGPVVFESEYDHGGHFAAWERPDAIVSDLRKMFGKGGGAFGVVSGRNGYDE